VPITVTDSFEDLLDTVRNTDLEAFAQADVPFENVVDACRPVRSQAFSPLAQVMLTLTTGAAGDRGFTGDDLTVAPLEAVTVAAQLDLSVTVETRPDGPWELTVLYATDLWDETSIGELAGRFITVLDAVVREPSARVGSVPIMSLTEKQRLTDWSSGSVPEVDGAAAGTAAGGATLAELVEFRAPHSGMSQA